MKSKNIFLFLPNIIGYLRIFLYAISFISHTLGHWLWCLVFYLIAFLLDELDGLAAISLEQTSQFGATLDMVTDRTATAGLCVILAQLYPSYLLIFILLIALDISSHYYLLQATSTQAENNHKNTARWSQNWLLNLYYGKKIFMDTLIFGNELFYMLLYLCYYIQGSNLLVHSIDFGQILWWIIFPIYLLKQITNIAQLQASAVRIASADLQQRQPLPSELKTENITESRQNI